MAGRPSKLNIALKRRMLALYERGKTDAEVAKITGISVRAIHYWKKKDPEFLHSLKEAKKIADDLVETALYLRAMGYSYEVEKLFCSDGEIIRAKFLRHVPPDVIAAIFWLKNRRPQSWR